MNREREEKNEEEKDEEKHREKKVKKKRNRKRNRSRCKPHPKDGKFPVSFPFTQRAKESPKVILFALAMSWHRHRDRFRLQSLLNQRRGIRIITVSDCLHSQGNYLHLTSHFHLPSGQKDIIAQIALEKLAAPAARVVCSLDYYFLQTRYYTKRYRKEWMKSSAHRLLLGGADEVVLPYDGGSAHEGKGSDMVDMLAGDRHPDIQVTFTSLEENLLWMASASKEIAAQLELMEQGCNELNTKRYLHPTTPFVTITLATSQ